MTYLDAAPRIQAAWADVTAPEVKWFFQNEVTDRADPKELRC